MIPTLPRLPVIPKLGSLGVGSLIEADMAFDFNGETGGTLGTWKFDEVQIAASAFE